MPVDEQLLISRYFKKSNYIEDKEIGSFLSFIKEANESNIIFIRPEVHEKIEAYFEKAMLQNIKKAQKLDFSIIKANFRFPQNTNYLSLKSACCRISQKIE